MSSRLLVTIGFLLMIWPGVAVSAEVTCQNLPQGSLSREECEYIQAKLKEQRETESASSQPQTAPLESITNFICPDEKAVEITKLTGTPGTKVQGTYRNVGQRAVSEVIVGFSLFDSQNQAVKTVEAAVLPRTIRPGQTGTFATVVPTQSELGWACFRYEITGLVD